MIIILQIIASVIPIIGTTVLMLKPKTDTSVKLLMANVGCFILDAGYFGVVSSQMKDTAMTNFRVQYLGTIIFYAFFILFILSYLNIKVKPWWPITWFAFELVILVIVLGNRGTDMVFKEIDVSEITQDIGSLGCETVYQVVTTQGVISMIRNGFLGMCMVVLIIVSIYKMLKQKNMAIRTNLGMLVGSETIVLATMIVNVCANNLRHFTPICSSLALLAIVMKLISGEFLTVADQAREWTFENMTDIVIITDTQYGFLDCNKAAYGLFPELVKMPKNEPVSERIIGCLEHNNEDYVIDDTTLHIEKRELRNYRNVVDGYCLLMQDVTEDRNIREQLEIEKQNADDANKAKSTFLSNISHEIRTPMNAIVGMTEILMREKHSTEDMEYLSSIQSSGQALLAIINDVLDFSKAESGKMSLVETPYDLHRMLKDLKLMLLTRSLEKPIELLFEIDEKLPRYVYGDSLRLRQVIINIVNNAIKFTKEGYVKLIVQVDKIDNQNASIYFCVKDTGAGIKDEDLDKLFKSFSQVDTKRNRNVEGTGLGLAISKQLVELMGGNIGVSSVYGKGSNFYFTINQRICTDEEVEEVANLNIDTNDQSGSAENFTAPEAQILIVDDNPMNLKVAKGLFAPIEMQIDTASSAAEAFEAINKKHYDIVFMDHMMPVMDGVEATIELRKSKKEEISNLIIIALTANAVQEAREEFTAAGMNDFIAKPINMNEVRDKLAKWLPAEKLVYKKAKRGAEKADEAVSESVASEKAVPTKLHTIDQNALSLELGLKNCGSEELLENLLSDFRKLIDVKANKMEKCLADGLIKDYTIEVHSLKSTARMIGAMELSELAKEMEALGNAGDIEALNEKNPAVMELYRSYKEKLSAYAAVSGTEKISEERFLAVLEMMAHAAESFDTDTIDEVMKELENAALDPKYSASLEKLRIQVADLATDDIIITIQEMRTL